MGEQTHNDVEGGSFDWACFSAQQAADKAVKAAFQATVRDRSVADLLRKLDKSRPVSSELQDAALELDKAHIPARYPNAHLSRSPRIHYT